MIPGSEDLLEDKMATLSSTPAWEIPWTDEAGGHLFMGSWGRKESDMTEHPKRKQISSFKVEVNKLYVNSQRVFLNKIVSPHPKDKVKNRLLI